MHRPCGYEVVILGFESRSGGGKLQATSQTWLVPCFVCLNGWAKGGGGGGGWREIERRMLLRDTRIRYKIQISVSIGKVGLEPATPTR